MEDHVDNAIEREQETMTIIRQPSREELKTLRIDKPLEERNPLRTATKRLEEIEKKFHARTKLDLKTMKSIEEVRCACTNSCLRLGLKNRKVSQNLTEAFKQLMTCSFQKVNYHETRYKHPVTLMPTTESIYHFEFMCGCCLRNVSFSLFPDELSPELKAFAEKQRIEVDLDSEIQL